eukprot:3941923-Pyramimonas_sp.AAC.1
MSPKNAGDIGCSLHPKEISPTVHTLPCAKPARASPLYLGDTDAAQVADSRAGDGMGSSIQVEDKG